MGFFQHVVLKVSWTAPEGSSIATLLKSMNSPFIFFVAQQKISLMVLEWTWMEVKQDVETITH